jgi:hypothetical protein
MEDFLAGRLVEVLDVRNLQRAYGLDGRRQGGIRLAAPPASRQVAPRFSQRSKDLRSIESLTCTMLAESHRRSDLIANINWLRAAGDGLRAGHTFPFVLSFE